MLSAIDAAWEHPLDLFNASLHSPTSSQAFQAGAGYAHYLVSPTLSPHSVASCFATSTHSPPMSKVRVSPHAQQQADNPMPACISPTQTLYQFNFQSPFHLHHQLHSQHQVLSSPTASMASSSMSCTTNSNCSSPSSPSVVRSLDSAKPEAAQSTAGKRSFSSSASTTCGSNMIGPSVKKPRACVSTKDFIPPDVSGLSRREARLVKNRAAAFLSRQRKREEFETMEIRVGELQRENAELKARVNGSAPPEHDAQIHIDASEVESLKIEIEHLRHELKMRDKKVLELEEDMNSRGTPAQMRIQSRIDEDEYSRVGDGEDLVKPEPREPILSANEPEIESQMPCLTDKLTIASKSGTSLGLMVLLCALPSFMSGPSTASTATATSSTTVSTSSVASSSSIKHGVHSSSASYPYVFPSFPSSSSDLSASLSFHSLFASGLHPLDFNNVGMEMGMGTDLGMGCMDLGMGIREDTLLSGNLGSDLSTIMSPAGMDVDFPLPHLIIAGLDAPYAEQNVHVPSNPSSVASVGTRNVRHVHVRSANSVSGSAEMDSLEFEYNILDGADLDIFNLDVDFDFDFEFDHFNPATSPSASAASYSLLTMTSSAHGRFFPPEATSSLDTKPKSKLGLEGLRLRLEEGGLVDCSRRRVLVRLLGATPRIQV